MISRVYLPWVVLYLQGVTLCGSAVFRHLRLSSILINASEVDSSTRVSWMLLQCAAATAPTGSDRGRGVEATRKPNKAFYKTPLQLRWGTNVQRQEEYNVRSKFTFEVRNIQPPLYQPRHPHLINKESPNHSPIITEYNQSHSLSAKPKSMEHHTTSTPPLRKVLSPKLLSLYNLLGLTSVGWSSLKLSSRTAASVKFDSGSHVASSIGYPVHIVRYS